MLAQSFQLAAVIAGELNTKPTPVPAVADLKVTKIHIDILQVVLSDAANSDAIRCHREFQSYKHKAPRG